METKVSKTRRLDFTCSVIASCNSTTKLKERLLSRFAVIEMEAYGSLEDFKKVTMDVLRHPLAEYIAEQVYQSSSNPNVRDSVRLGSMCKTEQDILRMILDQRRRPRRRSRAARGPGPDAQARSRSAERPALRRTRGALRGAALALRAGRLRPRIPLATRRRAAAGRARSDDRAASRQRVSLGGRDASVRKQ